MCITINRSMWRHGRGPISERSDELGGFWSKPSVKSRNKNHMRWLVLVKYCDLLDWIWAVTENRLEDHSSQWEATKRSVGLLTAMMIDAHRDWYQHRWMATVWPLICVNDRCMSYLGQWPVHELSASMTGAWVIWVNDRCMSYLGQWPVHESNGRDRNGNRHRNTSTTVEVVWRQKSTTQLWARSAACIRSLAKLSLVTFSLAQPAILLVVLLYNWSFV